MSLTEQERAVKHKLIDVTKELRKKIRAYRSDVNANEESFQQMFKPIAEPLTEVANLVKQQQAQLSKPE